MKLTGLDRSLLYGELLPSGYMKGNGRVPFNGTVTTRAHLRGRSAAEKSA